MPFGVTNAYSSFQHFINQVLQGTEAYCFSFIDNIFKFSPDFFAYKHYLSDIANRLNAYGVTLKMLKSALGKAEMEILGYYLSAKGTKLLNNKIVLRTKTIAKIETSIIFYFYTHFALT